MNIYDLQQSMLVTVAKALGGDLLPNVVFVGGCTTGLLVTDAFTKEQIRFTDDVDLIVDIIGYAQWANLQEQLSSKGFSVDMNENVLCRMLLGELKVDFMPVDQNTLGFTNRWYEGAVAHATRYELTEDITINLVSPEYFVATKIEAYLGRGNSDALSSHDIEDLLNIFDGRPQLVEEIRKTPLKLQTYISNNICELLGDENFEYAIQSLTRGERAREDLLFKRLQAVTIG